MKSSGAILVTGGYGFIGSNVVKRLFEAFPKHHIIVLDSLTYAGNLSNLPAQVTKSDRFSFVKRNICDRQAVSKVIDNCSAIVHLAAESHVDNSLSQADDFINSNVFGTMVLCEEALKRHIDRFVLISSSEAYGSAEHTPMDEGHALNPRSPYAASKVGSEKVAMSYYYSYELPLVVLRPFNNYGPYQHPEKVIPRFISCLLNNEKILLHNQGAQTRDWVFVGDTAHAIERVLKTPAHQLVGEVINIGTGRETSVRDIAHFIAGQLNIDESFIISGADRPGQVMRHLAGVEKAKQLMSWKSQISLEEGLSQTVAWYQNNRTWWQRLSITAPCP